MEDKNQKELLVILHNKIDDMSEKVHSIDVTVAKQGVSLDEHMKRTAMAEQRLEIFEEKVLPALDAYKFVEIVIKVAVPLFSCFELYVHYFKD